MKRIGLVVKHDARAIQTADELEGWLKRQGVAVLRQGLPAAAGEIRTVPPPADLACMLVLGGDGTFLSAVRYMGNPPPPTLGIKFGEVGFLAEIAEENLFEAVGGILKGDFTTTPRMRLEVTVLRGGHEAARETILNDVVINKGTLARLASIRTHLDGQYLTTYKADGLIVATPTGSTAYSLAAGGPVIHPEVAGIILTPICPFTLTVRPLVVPETATIEIGLEKKTPDIMLTFDGQAGMAIEEGDIITIRRSPHPLQLIHLPGQPYYEVLKAKLHWSGGRI